MNLILKVSKILNENFNPQSIISELNTLFATYLNVSNLNIYAFDDATKTLKDFGKSWLCIDEFQQNSQTDKLYLALAQFNQCDFFVNGKAYSLDSKSIRTNNSKNTALFPLTISNRPMGILEFNFDEEKDLDFFNQFSIIAALISFKVQNFVLTEQMQKNISFHDAMKNIAKIIESQYDLTYIIPVIGEIIDRFISEHLIYIFLKREESGKLELFWPLACRDKKVLEEVARVNSKSKTMLLDNDKMGLFPLITDKNLFGCIVAYSNIDKLNKEETGYLQELASQSATTINRANVYAEVLKHATIDALTGLNNRRHFELRLRQEVATAKRKNKPLCSIMLDVDFFKKVNDTYGHAAGDVVLKTVAQIIKEELREYDIPSRYGGEEFAILLPFTKIQEAFSVAQRLRQAIENTEIVVANDDNSEISINVTVSIGVYQYQKGDLPEILYQNADKALYEAKEHGRNKVVIF